MTEEKTREKAHRNLGLVVYSEEELQRIVKLAENATDTKGNEKYDFIGWILHDSDIDSETNTTKKEHYHILLKLAQPNKNSNKNITISAVAKQLKVEKHMIEILDCPYFSYHVKYLIHHQPKFHERGRYSKDKIQIVRNKTGKTLEDYLSDNSDIKKNLNYYISEIVNNRMTLEDVFEEDEVLYCKKLNTLENAEAKRVERIIPDTRVCFYITGNTGNGKTTIAKLLAKGLFLNDVKKYKIVDDKNLHKLIYFTGSKNVAFDKYRHQKVMVFDDIRDDTIKDIGGVEEAFKLFNNQPNTQSFNKKFGNVVINSEVMFLTNVEDIDTFISKTMKNEPLQIRNQLYRRLPVIIDIQGNQIVIKVSNYILSRLDKEYKGGREHNIYQDVLTLDTDVFYMVKNENIQNIKRITKEFLNLYKNIQKVFKRENKRKPIKVIKKINPIAKKLFK
jgi:hypothetical protein